MSDYTKELHDPATEAHLEEPLEDNDGTSSGILLEKSDYEHSSPELNSLHSSAILERPEEQPHPHHTGDHKRSTATAGTSRPNTLSTSHSTELSTHVVDLNQTMPWKLFYPFISRETILALCKATAINFLLPFVNGVFLGFGEICAHELTYRWGWTHSAHVVSVPGRRAPESVNAGNVGIRAAGVSGAGSVGSVSGTSGSGYAGSRSGIGGLGRYEDEF
ncbi:hypothetical protein BGZ70_007396 [Mortierella alpina]|uniref:Uncharacterized protein n=1 Tax=Mortierella alpina TaxID=64518 RepID=A0A9P6M327_MORAP|nr:hypothetical protein BGZ70_007396 [Mortierella alpina]